MAVRLVILGPGRVGQALGRRWQEAGVSLLGFLGRDQAKAEAACAFAGGGRPCGWADVKAAHAVVVAVGDPDVEALASQAVKVGAVRSCSLWLHTSGRLGLSALLPVEQAGARTAGFHPAMPFPDAERGYAALDGSPCVLLPGHGSQQLLAMLCHKARMRPCWADPRGDRIAYHAACALAANGLTALRAAVDAVFAHSGSLAAADADFVAHALMQSALAACRDSGPTAALTGPVLRGDAAALSAHRRALSSLSLPVQEAYRALMAAALPLAAERGLPQALQHKVEAALADAPDQAGRATPSR